MEGEPASEEGLPRPVSLGLEELSESDRLDIGDFITVTAPWLMRQYDEESRAVEAHRSIDTKAVDVEALAVSESVEDRDIACSLVAQYAEVNPSAAFPLWEKLMLDDDYDVRKSAQRALAVSLGRRRLEPQSVVRLVHAIWERINRDDGISRE